MFESTARVRGARHSKGSPWATLGIATALLLGLGGSTADAGAFDWATGPATYHEEGKRDWSVALTPYLWVANLNGELSLPPTGTIPVSATFPSIASGLDGAFAGVLEVKWRRWSLISDNSWVRIKQQVAPELVPVTSAELEAQVAFGTVAVAYNLPLEWNTAVDVYMGVRWWFVDSTASLFTVPFGPVTGQLTQTWADFVVGTRVTHHITEKWRVVGIADIGGGAAKLDWQLFGAVGYMFTPNVGMSAGYRLLGVNYDDQLRTGTFSYDIKQGGLMLGFNFVY